jgi:hypothetical protein
MQHRNNPGDAVCATENGTAMLRRMFFCKVVPMMDLSGCPTPVEAQRAEMVIDVMTLPSPPERGHVAPVTPLERLCFGRFLYASGEGHEL